MAAQLSAEVRDAFRATIKKAIVSHVIHGDFVHSDFTKHNYIIDLTGALLEPGALNAATQLLADGYVQEANRICCLSSSPASMLLGVALSRETRNPVNVVLSDLELPVSDSVSKFLIKGPLLKEADHVLLIGDVNVTGKSILRACSALSVQSQQVRAVTLVDYQRALGSGEYEGKTWPISAMFTAAEILAETRLPAEGIDNDILVSQAKRLGWVG